jgi:hypothetical protein
MVRDLPLEGTDETCELPARIGGKPLAAGSALELTTEPAAA